jgi:hypothetical protein
MHAFCMVFKASFESETDVRTSELLVIIERELICTHIWSEDKRRVIC